MVVGAAFGRGLVREWSGSWSGGAGSGHAATPVRAIGGERDGADGWLPGRWLSGIESVTVDPRDGPRSCGVRSRAPASAEPQQARLPARWASAAAENRTRTAELVARQTLVSNLGWDFNTRISQLRPAPWFQSVTIDPSSHLPVVDNVSFESLQADGGGTATCIKVATTGSWPLLRVCGARGLLGQQATEMAEDPGVDSVGVAVDPVRGRRSARSAARGPRAARSARALEAGTRSCGPRLPSSTGAAQWQSGISGGGNGHGSQADFRNRPVILAGQTGPLHED